jgi:hypothetical protein
MVEGPFNLVKHLSVMVGRCFVTICIHGANTHVVQSNHCGLPFHGHSHEVSQKNKKFMIRLHRVLSLWHELINSLLKGIWETKCERNEFLNSGSKRNVHGQFGQSQFGRLRLKRMNKNPPGCLKECVFFVFSVCFRCWNLGCSKRQSCHSGKHFEREKKC